MGANAPVAREVDKGARGCEEKEALHHLCWREKIQIDNWKDILVRVQ